MDTLEEELLAAVPDRQDAKVEELRFDISQGCWWDTVNGKPYINARSVNNLIPKSGWPVKMVRDDDGKEKEVFIKPADWLTAENKMIVHDSIWWPGQPRIIEGFMVINGEVVASGNRGILFNTYRPPDQVKAKEGVTADKWIDHVKALWPIEDEHNFFFDVCAHMVQKPEEKANGVIALSGEQGVGKDMALDPVRAAIRMERSEHHA